MERVEVLLNAGRIERERLCARRVKFLKVLARGMDAKIAILELLRKRACLHLSGLYKCLKEEKGIKISLGTLHKYVEEMVKAGILECERGEKFNILFLRISDNEIVNWLLRFLYFGAPYDGKPEHVEPINYYLEVVKPRWENIIVVFWANKRITFKRYAPLLVVMLTASGVDPAKQIDVLNNVAKKIGGTIDRVIEVSVGEVTKVVEEELKEINPNCAKTFKELYTNMGDLRRFASLLEKYLPRVNGFLTRGDLEFVRACKRREEEQRKMQLEAWQKVWRLYVLPHALHIWVI